MSTVEERRSEEDIGTDLRGISIGDQDLFGKCGQRCCDLHRVLEEEDGDCSRCGVRPQASRTHHLRIQLISEWDPSPILLLNQVFFNTTNSTKNVAAGCGKLATQQVVCLFPLLTTICNLEHGACQSQSCYGNIRSNDCGGDGDGSG